MSKKLSFHFRVQGERRFLFYIFVQSILRIWDMKKIINPRTSGVQSFETLLEKAETVIQALNFSEYEDIVFIGKSLGTVVACYVKEKYKIPAKMILFTPIAETMEYINADNDILLVAVGTKDRYLDAKVLKALCDKEKINCYIEEKITLVL